MAIFASHEGVFSNLCDTIISVYFESPDAASSN